MRSYRPEAQYGHHGTLEYRLLHVRAVGSEDGLDRRGSRAMTPDGYFFFMVLGLPLLILVIAMLGGCLYRGGYEQLLDWKPTRSPKREAELALGDTHQMLSALNRYRRSRGAPERSLQEITEHAWAGLEEHGGEWP
jgi:hypothetical protein